MHLNNTMLVTGDAMICDVCVSIMNCGRNMCFVEAADDNVYAVHE